MKSIPNSLGMRLVLVAYGVCVCVCVCVCVVWCVGGDVHGGVCMHDM